MGSHPAVTPADGSVPRFTRIDGNALAGALGDLGDLDLTTATAECRACGAAEMLAAAVVERDDDGVIVICRSCTHTLFSLVWTRGRMRIELGSLAALRF